MEQAVLAREAVTRNIFAFLSQQSLCYVAETLAREYFRSNVAPRRYATICIINARAILASL
jgi:hypothetical protein